MLSNIESSIQSDLVLENLLISVLIVDDNGTILYANKSAKKLFGKSTEKLLASKFGFPVIPSEIQELQIPKTDGIVIVEMLASSLQWNGQNVHLLSLRDITEKKRLEEELKQTNRLQDNLNSALLESNEALLQFAHVASHDLKEPLRKIMVYSGMLESDAESDLSPAGKKYLSKINAASAHMAGMIDGVLKYSGIDAVDHPFESIDLGDTFKAIIHDLEVLISEKRATIEYNDLPRIEGIPVLIHQLFYNLISNSLKFCHTDRPSVITVTSSTAGRGKKKYVIINIRDNGIGFSQAYSEKIFTIFARLHSRHEYEGTGLGLALCKRIVERHGGEISAIGKENEGCVFSVKLPVRPVKKGND